MSEPKRLIVINTLNQVNMHVVDVALTSLIKKCPAPYKLYMKCKKHGLFAKMCQTKFISAESVDCNCTCDNSNHELNDIYESEDKDYLDSDDNPHLIQAVHSPRCTKWWVKLQINDKSIGVHIDTEADRSLLPYCVFK